MSSKDELSLIDVVESFFMCEKRNLFGRCGGFHIFFTEFVETEEKLYNFDETYKKFTKKLLKILLLI